MVKYLTITTDKLSLIKNLNFDTFEMGDLFSTNRITDTINMIEASNEAMQKFGPLRDELIRIKDQLAVISDRKERYAWGIDQWSLWGGTYVLEQISLLIDCYDKFIPGTEENASGKEFPPALEEYMWELYHFMVDNMPFILSLVFYYADKGGLEVGQYKYKDGVWSKTDTVVKEIRGKNLI